mmetsp:Transcript_28254/g.91089  ORF Transcript_28254/g.91089 Transcript_28254/m.91089 type:complete len:378 (-) Transcript_28254:641-1774(-)
MPLRFGPAASRERVRTSVSLNSSSSREDRRKGGRKEGRKGRPKRSRWRVLLFYVGVSPMSSSFFCFSVGLGRSAPGPLRSPYLGLWVVLAVGLAGHGELGGEGDDLFLEGLDVVVVDEGLREVDELFGREGGLDFERDGDGFVEEVGDGDEVVFREAPGGHGRGADADAAGGEGGDVAGDGVFVEGDLADVANFLELGAREARGSEVPEDEVVVGAAGGEGVAVVVDEALAEGLDVFFNLLGVGLEGVGLDFPELDGDAGDLVFVGPALEGREDGVVDLVLEAAAVLLEEDDARPRAPEGLVRGRGHDVAVVEGVRRFFRGDEARDVGHVHHQEGAVVVGDLPEASVVPVSGVGGSAADYESRFKNRSHLLQVVEVY